MSREILKDYEYRDAKETNEYLKNQNPVIREKIIEILLDDICINCFDVNEGRCHCTNDE